MNHGSLFSGIGGFDLAAEWCGWNNIFQVEIDKFCRKVLEKNFPNTKRYEDIKQFDGTEYAGTIDVISGGFPCQPFSIAGKRKGKDDDRALWYEMFRVIQQVKPAWIVAENVSGLLTIENGMVFDQVLSDMENAGYEVQPYIIPACATNAPHRRDRVWIVANRNGIAWESSKHGNRRWGYGDTNRRKRSLQTSGSDSDAAHTAGERLQRTRRAQLSRDRGRSAASHRRQPELWYRDWTEVATALCRVDDGIPRQLDRTARLKSLGNAIVPQVVYEIFNAINQIDDTRHNN